MNNRELFFSLLGAELAKEGFEYKKSINGFSKKENGNEYLYEFEIWPQFMQIDPNYRILIKEVEQVKKKAWGKFYRKFESVGDYKYNLLPKEETSTHWTDTEEAVRIAVQKEIDYYYSDLKEYFRIHSDINFLDRHLNDEPNKFRIVAHNSIHTSFLAVIVAKLSDNDQLPKLISFYKNLISPEFMEEYKLLSEYIKQTCSGANSMKTLEK